MATSPDAQVEDPVFDKFQDESDFRSSGDTNATPNSELSPPDSPASKTAGLAQIDDKRANSRRLAASLTLEEQVSWLPINAKAVISLLDLGLSPQGK